MAKIVRSPLARNNLKRIYDFIAEDSPLSARNLLKEIIKATRNLERFPSLGRKVPELKNSNESSDICDSSSRWPPRTVLHSRGGWIALIVMKPPRRPCLPRRLPRVPCRHRKMRFPRPAGAPSRSWSVWESACHPTSNRKPAVASYPFNRYIGLYADLGTRTDAWAGRT